MLLDAEAGDRVWRPEVYCEIGSDDITPTVPPLGSVVYVDRPRRGGELNELLAVATAPRANVARLV